MLSPLLHLFGNFLYSFRLEAIVLSHIQSLRRKSESGAACLDDVHDSQEDILPDAEELGPVSSIDVGYYLDVQRIRPEVDESDPGVSDITRS